MFRFYEGGGFGEVVDHKGRLRVAVVHGCEGGETFLARGVPYFKFDSSVREMGLLSEEGGCERKGISDMLRELVDSGWRSLREGFLTADSGLFVFLEIIVYEAENER